MSSLRHTARRWLAHWRLPSLHLPVRNYTEGAASAAFSSGEEWRAQRPAQPRILLRFPAARKPFPAQSRGAHSTAQPAGGRRRRLRTALPGAERGRAPLPGPLQKVRPRPREPGSAPTPASPRGDRQRNIASHFRPISGCPRFQGGSHLKGPLIWAFLRQSGWDGASVRRRFPQAKTRTRVVLNSDSFSQTSREEGGRPETGTRKHLPAPLKPAGALWIREKGNVIIPFGFYPPRSSLSQGDAAVFERCCILPKSSFLEKFSDCNPESEIHFKSQLNTEYKQIRV